MASHFLTLWCKVRVACDDNSSKISSSTYEFLNSQNDETCIAVLSNTEAIYNDNSNCNTEYCDEHNINTTEIAQTYKLNAKSTNKDFEQAYFDLTLFKEN